MKLSTLKILVGGVFLAAMTAPPVQAATVEEALAGINKLPAKERQRRLEEGAKKEGSLVVYSNQGVETIQEYADAFRKNIRTSKSKRRGCKAPRGWTVFCSSTGSANCPRMSSASTSTTSRS